MATVIQVIIMSNDDDGDDDDGLCHAHSPVMMSHVTLLHSTTLASPYLCLQCNKCERVFYIYRTEGGYIVGFTFIGILAYMNHASHPPTCYLSHSYSI